MVTYLVDPHEDRQLILDQIEDSLDIQVEEAHSLVRSLSRRITHEEDLLKR